MSNRILTVVLIISCCALVSHAEMIETDLDVDGSVERIEIDTTKAMSLRVFRGNRLLWEAVPKQWKPWKLAIADVDGDGKREIAVGVYKSTKFFPKPHNCLFIYGWSGEKGYPKWLGSSLGRQFTDFVFVGLDDYAGTELVAVETTLDGKQSLAVYHWNSFGFTRYLDFGPWAEADLVEATGTNIELRADGESLVIDLEKKWRNQE
ncbi:MAG: hypothetical protein OEQ28_06070 [Acidobacteriota bacterium]|nr:hypothetical protein [Acidobacteriota bacterium]